MNSSVSKEGTKLNSATSVQILALDEIHSLSEETTSAALIFHLLEAPWCQEQVSFSVVQVKPQLGNTVAEKGFF